MVTLRFFYLGFNRTNLSLSVKHKNKLKSQLLDFIKPRVGQPGLYIACQDVKRRRYQTF